MLSVGADRHAAHRFDAARDTVVDDARGDQVVNEVIGLLRGTALAVDRGGRHLVGERSRQPGGARDIETLLADLRDATTDDLADVARIDVCALQDSLLHVTEQVRGVYAGQAAVAPDDPRGFGRRGFFTGVRLRWGAEAMYYTSSLASDHASNAL